MERLRCIALGDYALKISSGYITAMQVFYRNKTINFLETSHDPQENDVIDSYNQGNAFVDLATHHQDSALLPATWPAYKFNQTVAPVNYDRNKYGPWEPLTVLLVPGIPSRYLNF